MLRKITLGLIAAASLGAVALIPGVASAGGIHFGIGGWNGSYGIHGVYAGPTLYVGGLTEGCLRKQIIETRRGQRVRWVNVCAN